MTTTLETINFNYSDEDIALFQDGRSEQWANIEQKYVQLRERCLEELPMPIQTTQREWVRSRTNRHLVTSIMRLLYLGESFCDACTKFNAPAAAVHVKAMVEPVLHIANLAWVLDNHRDDFERIRTEYDQMAWGHRDTGELTTRARISQRTLYQRADTVFRRLGGNEENIDVSVFEQLYRESNATGHHNFEGRDMLVGVSGQDDVWRPKDRKEWFVFVSNIFGFFLYAETVFSMSYVFIYMIDYYLEHMPETITKPKTNT